MRRSGCCATPPRAAGSGTSRRPESTIAGPPRTRRLRTLAKAAYGQGREVRHHDRRSGKARPISAELRTLAGCAWHTVRRRCAYGIVMGARTAGTLREAVVERRG